MRALNNQDGAAMLVALALLLMMGLTGVAAIQTSSTDVTITDNYRQDMRSFYTAEAGVEHACAVLRDSVDWRTGLSGIGLGGGQYSVRVLDVDSIGGLDDSVLVIATGERSGARSTIEVLLARQRPFRWSAFADSAMALTGTTETDSYDSDSGTYVSTQLDAGGDVGSNGVVDISGDAMINGDASTSQPGAMEIDGNAVVGGDTTTTAEIQDFAPVTQDDIDYAKSVNAAPAGLSGHYTYNAFTGALTVKPGKTMTLNDGTYYFSSIDMKGEVIIAPGATVKIYMDGNLTVNSDVAVNVAGTPSQLQIFSRGDKISINGGATICAVIYAPDTEIERLNGGAELFGAYIAKKIKENGGTHFHFDRSLRDLIYGTRFDRIAWREM